MSGKGGRQPPARHAFKVLCPEPLISSVMGPRGTVKDQIQDETGCKLIVSNRDEYFPNTRLRILVIYNDEVGGIANALGRVVGHIGTCGEKERLDGSPHFVGNENEFLGKEPGEYILRAAIPSKASGGLIGAKGANIQAIRDECHAKIFIDKHVEQGHQVVKLIAGLENMQVAVARINEAVQEESRSDAFREWAMVRSFPGSAAGPAPQQQQQQHQQHQQQQQQQQLQQRQHHHHDAGEIRWGEDAPPHAWERSGHESHQIALHADGYSGGYGKGGGHPEQRSRGHGGRQRSRSRNRELQQPAQFEPPDLHSQSLDAIFSEFPEGTLDVEYAITCDLPRAKVSALIGKSGEHIKHVRRVTNTQVRFDEGAAGGKGETQTMMVRGHLADVYKAHALMMKKYHEDEVDMQRNAHVQGLQEQLMHLQKQLESATKGSAKGSKKGK